ncbi:MAG: CHAT domain-containing protein [Acidobacteria bacterium]|nr:CHAT domain-containing protein [Acidobacteriota bacterium]
MVTESSELKREFLLAHEDTTVGELRETLQARGNLWLYVAVLLNGRGYAVFRLGELIETLKLSEPAFRPELLSRPLRDVRGLLAERSASPVEERALSPGEVRRLFRDAPRGRWVVLKDGEVAGVLVGETRSAASGMDLDWLHAAPARAEATRGRRAAPPPPSPPLAPVAAPPRSRVLSAADRPPAMAPPPAAAAAERAGPPRPSRAEPVAAEEPPEEPRWINAQLEGRDPGEPLRVDEPCTIAFDVDVQVRAGSLVRNALLTYGFAPAETMLELTVQLSSEDFEVLTEPQKLRVPRRGKSSNKARFDIRPKREGDGVLQAVFLKDGNFVQLVTVRLQVGGSIRSPAPSPTSLGRGLDASFALQPRDVTLVLTSTGAGFQAILAGPVYANATLPITLPELDQMIGQARNDLQGIVDLEPGAGGSPSYQAGIDIPPEVADAALRVAAKAGFRLFQRVFFGPAADAQSRLLGSRLREMSQREKLKIQILSERFPLPWGILYMADPFDPDHIDPEMFLGFKHVIEHIPLQPAMQVLANRIDGRPLLSVSLNVNADIDAQMGIPVIAEQLAYWKETSKRVGTKLVVRKTDDEVKRALADTSSSDQLVYFYCHAVSKSLAEGGGPDASALVLTGDGRLTLGDLALFAPIGSSLAGAPLVFINACESAEMSPLFYDGFVPYFMGKGARGVIGTECQTPAIFAAEWARRFFDAFLTGKTVGEVFLELRREFYEKHNNLLGLLYALYCDGDTRLDSAAA